MTITLNPQTEAKLRAKADQEGQDINSLADELLGLILDWDAQDRAEAITGIQKGLQAFDEGRFRSFKEFAAEQRTRLMAEMNQLETQMDRDRTKSERLKFETQMIKANTEAKLTRLEEQVNNLPRTNY